MAIDVGNACTDRGTTSSSGFTAVDKANPANAAGSINSVCVYIATDASGIEFGAFTDNGSNSLTCQAGHHCSGANLSCTAAESPKTFTAPGDFTAFSIDSGEYIGRYFTGGTWEADNSGLSGIWYLESDEISDDNTDTFTSLDNWGISLYATGTEAGGGAIPMAMDIYRQRRV